MKKFLFLLLLILPLFVQAQDPEMADTMRSEGKIYVVVAVILVILAGLIAYLYTIDRKATRLEKKLDERSGIS